MTPDGPHPVTDERRAEGSRVSRANIRDARVLAASTRREIIAALMDHQGLGLHVLVQLRATSPMPATALATATEADLTAWRWC